LPTRDLYTAPVPPGGWTVPMPGDTRFTWEYDDAREKLLAL
jgi:hypothetical protein